MAENHKEEEQKYWAIDDKVDQNVIQWNQGKKRKRSRETNLRIERTKFAAENQRKKDKRRGRLKQFVRENKDQSDE